jgi:hypothetical protein
LILEQAQQKKETDDFQIVLVIVKTIIHRWLKEEMPKQ